MSFEAMAQRIIPGPIAEDDDDIVVALETARVSEERRDLESAVRWLQRAVSAARRQGRPERAGTISRSILKLGGPQAQFEHSTPSPHVLGEVGDDDFADETIVGSAFGMAAKEESDLLVPKPTPVAPLTTQTRSPYYSTLRVAVRKALGGRFDVRSLNEGERPHAGEYEAFLVPVNAETKL